MNDIDNMTSEQVNARLAEIREANAFIGPLPKGLIREYASGEVTLAHGIKNAREFVLAAAALMRHRGREVRVEETAESVYVSAIAPRWFDHSVLVHAVKYSSRWKFLGASVIGGDEAATYSEARSLINVYGR